ncbi:MAG: hypothetical protein OEY67_00180 [Gammaproteobacteria bacterium]|nr:hypothetical protein [Gammaproteobacteria bacterium]
MTDSAQQDLHLAEIRELAQRYSAEMIEQCLQQALSQQENPCFDDDEVQKVVSVLAKAEFVKSLMSQGKTLSEAMRELGRRIRAVQNLAK